MLVIFLTRSASAFGTTRHESQRSKPIHARGKRQNALTVDLGERHPQQLVYSPGGIPLGPGYHNTAPMTNPRSNQWLSQATNRASIASNPGNMGQRPQHNNNSMSSFTEKKQVPTNDKHNLQGTVQFKIKRLTSPRNNEPIVP